MIIENMFSYVPYSTFFGSILSSNHNHQIPHLLQSSFDASRSVTTNVGDGAHSPNISFPYQKYIFYRPFCRLILNTTKSLPTNGHPSQNLPQFCNS